MEYKEKKRILFLGLPWTFTTYHINDDYVTVKQGFFNQTEDNCYMYRVQDIKMTRTIGEKLMGLGTLHLYCGDVTTPEIVMKHIKNYNEIKDYLLKATEEARLRRRTVNMQDISNHGVDDPS